MCANRLNLSKQALAPKSIEMRFEGGTLSCSVQRSEQMSECGRGNQDASYFAGLERNRSRSLVLIEIGRFFEEVCVKSVECVAGQHTDCNAIAKTARSIE